MTLFVKPNLTPREEVVVELRNVPGRVRRVAAAVMHIAKAPHDDPRSVFVRRAEYGGSFIMFDNMLADILIPRADVGGDALPEDIRETCADLDALRDQWLRDQWRPPQGTYTEDLRAACAQLAQLLMETLD